MARKLAQTWLIDGYERGSKRAGAKQNAQDAKDTQMSVSIDRRALLSNFGILSISASTEQSTAPPLPPASGDSDNARPANILTFEQYGAVGDGVTDDLTAINACSADAVARGITEIAASAGKTYRINSPLALRSDLNWNGNGSTISSGAAIWFFQDDTLAVPIGTVTEDVVGPTDTLYVSSVADISIGDWVGVRLGNNKWDHAEPRYAFAAQVADLTELTLIVNWIIPYSISIKDATKSNRSIFRLKGNPHNVVMRDFVFRGDQVAPGVEGGMFLKWGVGLTFDNIQGNLDGTGDMGAGLIGLLQFCRHVMINNPKLYSNRNTRGQPSFGRMFNFSNCIDVIVSRPVGINLQNSFAFIESYCEDIYILSPTLVYRRAVTDRWNPLLFFGQNSDVVIDSPKVTINYTAQTFLDAGGALDVAMRGATVKGVMTWRGPMPHGVCSLATFRAIFDFNDGAGDVCIVDFSAPLTNGYAISLTDNMYRNYYFAGPVIDYLLCASSGVNTTSVVGCYLGYGDVNGVNLVDELRPGNAVSSSYRSFGLDYGGVAALTSQAKFLLHTGIELQPSNSFVGILARIGKVVYASSVGSGPGSTHPMDDTSMELMLSGHKCV